MLAGLKSIIAGTLAGAILPSLLLGPNYLLSIGNPAADSNGALELLLMPIGISFGLASVTLFVLIWPISAILMRRPLHRERNFILAGMCVSAALTQLLFPFSVTMAALGGLTGAATGKIWIAGRLKPGIPPDAG